MDKIKSTPRQNLDYMENESQTRNRTQEFGFKVRTKYGVYSCLSLPFLRIENRAKIKRHVFCWEIWILERKH